MEPDSKPERSTRGCRFDGLGKPGSKLVFFDDFASVPALIRGSARYLSVFIAMDATQLDDQSLRSTSKELLEMGVVCLCAWGPDCERVHDCFDLERSPNETLETCIMTTWHAKETLEEAAWYFVNCALPADGFQGECDAVRSYQEGHRGPEIWRLFSLRHHRRRVAMAARSQYS